MKLKPVLLASTICVLPFAASAAVAAPFTWTGFYVGGSAGFISQNSTATPLDDQWYAPIGDVYGNGGHGFLGGVNIGYNYQTGAVVFGIEADISGSTVDNSVTTWWGDKTISSKLEALGTLRGRIGYAYDRALIYATGGLAYGKLTNSINVGWDTAENSSYSGWKAGWTAGGGLEYAIANNWTVRVEGLYVDLGNTTSTDCNGCRFGFKNTYTVGRLGLNFKY